MEIKEFTTTTKQKFNEKRKTERGEMATRQRKRNVAVLSISDQH